MTEIDYRDYFFYIATLITVVSIGYYAWNRHRLPPYIRYLAAFLTMHLTLDFIALFLARAGIPNLPLLHLYTLLEFVLLGLFYRSLLRSPYWLPPYFRWFFGAGVVFIVANTLFLQAPFEFNSYAKTFSSTSIILFALLYFYNSILGEIAAPQRSGLHLINTGLFVFYMGTLLIFLFSDFLRRNDQNILFEIWNANLILSILLQSLLLIGLVLVRQGSVDSAQAPPQLNQELLPGKRN